MARKKYDFRTEAEKKRDEECVVIAKRFKELAPYAEHPNRVFVLIANELGLKRTCVRSRLIRMGFYIPGEKRGWKSGFTINLNP